MATLDDLKKRIASVKSTQKITKAMKMVAAAKLRRAQENAEKGRPYSEKMNNIILNLSSGISDKENAPKLLSGTGEDKIHLCEGEDYLENRVNASYSLEFFILFFSINHFNQRLT